VGAPDRGGGASGATSSSASTSAQRTATTSASTSEVIVADESFMIGEHECTVLADGNFYCSKSADATGGTPSAADFGPARVLAQPDHQGDQEIYLLDGGATVQLTFNDYDDLAPVIDDATLRIAWHAMVGERLQIMLYDRSTGATRQVTDTSYNNSNPHLFGDLLVWQAWVDGNWEIYLAEDLAQDEPRITRLTENTRHDMFPKVFDEYVTWEAQTPDGWHVVVYDTTTERYSLVKKRGDGNYENPRFALLIDNRSEDGAVETIGFDVGTDEEIPLSPAPAPTPDPVTPDEHSGEAVLPASASSSSKLEEGEGQR
jgi:beta propeller repeat protein